MNRWTEKQLEAINDRGHNLLVAAAAGSGKTAVLVERIIQLVRQDRIDIDRLLIVTFTQAAAGEMRSRISSRLLEAMQAEGADQDFLRHQVNLLNQASISTLHSFCLDVVHRYFHIIDISPSFRVGDATETALLKLEVLEELFEAEYESGEPGFLDLVEIYAGGRDDTPLRELVLRTYEFIQSQPDPLAWLHLKVEDFNLEDDQFAHSGWVSSLMKQIEIELAGVEEIFSQAAQLAAQPGGPWSYLDALQDDISMVQELRSALGQGIYAFHECLSQAEHRRLGAARKDVDPVLKQEVQDLREQGKKVIKELGSQIMFMSPAEFCQDLRAMYPGMGCLAGLVEKFHHRYRESKTERGLADFNDLEHYALEILADPLTAAEYRRQFEHIFVDEYQDSNLVQETILNRIKRGDNLFLVGDVKQSIYRFRLADPSLFLEKYQAYQDPQGRPDRRIDLSANFRSRRPIIDAVNDIFSRIMSRQFGEIDYRPEVFLEYGLQLPDDTEEELDTGRLELVLIDKKKGTAANEMEDEPAGEEEGVEPAELGEEPGDVEFEAQAVAARIKELHGQVFYDSKGECYRPLEYCDMVVLMRATRGQADIYYETLMASGIPVYADVDRGYFETAEMKVFISLLHLIDNKRQDIPLLSVMRSPIGKFTVEELIEIRASSGAPTYYEAVEEYLSSGQDALAEKLAAFIGRLNDWKEAARFLPMDELIWQLLLETGYLNYAGAMPGGQQRQANLRILLERARQYQATSMQGLFHFLKFIEKLESSSSDLGMAKILGESEDVVRIMSIHKSKGLEFPVVMVAGLGRKFNLSDTRAPIMFHKELGIGPRYINPDLRVTRDTIARAALASQIRAENLAEEMRILYVACTRPRDKLILFGTVSDLGKRVKRWNKGVSPFQLARASGLLDWLGAVVMQHPDGKPLRGYDPAVIRAAVPEETGYNWLVKIIDRSQTGAAQAAAQAQSGFEQRLLQTAAEEGSELRDRIWSRLDWAYPHAAAIDIPSKIAVSQVNNLVPVPKLLAAGYPSEALPVFREPRFMAAVGRGEAVLSGAARGVILHTVMQHLDFKRAKTLADIELQVEGLVKRELLLPEEAAAVDRGKILKFLASPLGQRVLAADRIEREVPFNLLCDAAEIFPDLALGGEQLLLQGVIDLYFREGDQLVLVDYKSDRVTPYNKEALISGYRVQLKLYKTALKKILGQPVKASYLYLFDIDEAVPLHQ
ncbi:MAG: helicase-exonuclease AddAB subunit AddA [Syntrophomonadaceae bacterium]